MSYLFNTVNNVKSLSSGNIALGLSSLISSPSNTNVLGIDTSGNAKKLSSGAAIGDIVLSYVTNSAGWGGSPAITEGFQTFMRGASCTVEENSSLVTRVVAGGAQWFTGWTLVAGDYLMLASWAFSTAGGGDCNAQFYDATNSNYVGSKMHFETGNFSNRLIYYTSISSNTKFEIRARDVNSVGFLDSTSMFACTLQIFKV
jgi:hypothetical protein